MYTQTDTTEVGWFKNISLYIHLKYDVRAEASDYSEMSLISFNKLVVSHFIHIASQCEDKQN